MCSIDTAVTITGSSLRGVDIAIFFTMDYLDWHTFDLTKFRFFDPSRLSLPNLATVLYKGLTGYQSINPFPVMQPRCFAKILFCKKLDQVSCSCWEKLGRLAIGSPDFLPGSLVCFSWITVIVANSARYSVFCSANNPLFFHLAIPPERLCK